MILALMEFFGERNVSFENIYSSKVCVQDRSPLFEMTQKDDFSVKFISLVPVYFSLIVVLLLIWRLG